MTFDDKAKDEFSKSQNNSKIPSIRPLGHLEWIEKIKSIHKLEKPKEEIKVKHANIKDK